MLKRPFRFRSRADFDPGDFRLRLPRFTEENFPKNLVLADKFKSLGQKLQRTPSQIALAWILAKYDNCKCTYHTPVDTSKKSEQDP